MPIRIAQGNDNYLTDTYIATAFRWAVANGADILSNSWGFRNWTTVATHSAIMDITQPGGIGRDGKGCVVIAAAHNDNGPVRRPAAYSEVIAVGSVDHHSVRWYYSNYGLELDIVAPSGGLSRQDYLDNGTPFLWTTDISGPAGITSLPAYPFPEIEDYVRGIGGTSAACPQVAGVAALILSVDPNLTNIEVKRILEESAVDLGDPGWDELYGHGRVDARAALERVLSLRGDFNADLRVDLEDFSKLALFWGQSEMSIDIAPLPDGDGVIDFRDLSVFLEHWLDR